MFTGIVLTTGIVRLQPIAGGDQRLRVEFPAAALGTFAAGDSVCVSGVCLTALALQPGRFHADVSAETLSLTTLGALADGHPVNLEPAATLSTLMGGHLVSGHVDGTGTLVWRKPDARSERMRFRAPFDLARYIAAKGSICIDGVSLTLGVCERQNFWVYLISHTMGRTTLQGLRAGDRVNLEADIIGKYVEKFLANRGLSGSGEQGLSRAFLAKHGFTAS